MTTIHAIHPIVTPDTYEIYIDLRPANVPTEQPVPRDPGLWTLSDALVSRGARSVGSTVPLPTHGRQPNRLRRKRSLLDRLLRRHP